MLSAMSSGQDSMLYALHAIQRSFLNPVANFSQKASDLLEGNDGLPARMLRANLASLHRITKAFDKPAFGITHANAHGAEMVVVEEEIDCHPFCRLVRFARRSEEPTTAAALAADPRVLVVAPLSGHFATLLRDTVATLLRDHDVYVTDWVDARDVPVAEGAFSLDDYVVTVQRFIRKLGAANLHVIAVCQPTVPVLGAVALMAGDGEPTPRSLTLMGGPVDARRSPTEVNRLATEHTLAWFETNMIHRVPAGYAGHGRAVYPGFLQLTAFTMMNPERHAESYGLYWLDRFRGAAGAERAKTHETFYDEYNAVLDMDAAYYLDTVEKVFQQFALARGTWVVNDERVRPETISTTALFTIEGANDDISGLGQTEAAHDLCTAIPKERRRHLVAEGCGHYGIFSGRRWREAIYPEVRAFIRAAEAAR